MTGHILFSVPSWYLITHGIVPCAMSGHCSHWGSGQFPLPGCVVSLTLHFSHCIMAFSNVSIMFQSWLLSPYIKRAEPWDPTPGTARDTLQQPSLTPTIHLYPTGP